MISIRKILSLVCTLCILLTAINVYAAETFQSRIIDDFEFKDSRCNWWIQNTNNAILSLSSQQAHSGTRSLKYAYNYESAEIGIISTEWSKGGQLVKNITGYRYIGCWVYTEKTGMQIAIHLRDSNNSQIRSEFLNLAVEGWQYLEWPLSEALGNDMRIYEFVVKKTQSDNGDDGTIYFDDLQLSKTSYYAAGGSSNEIAGMAGVNDTSAFVEGAPTLSEVNVPAVTRKSPQTMQLDNDNEFKSIKFADSKKLPDSISGIALGDSGSVLSIMSGTVGVEWAAPWLNDGEELYGKVQQTTYSSGMHSGPDATEWVKLTFPEQETIQSVKIYPRNASALCFPSSYTIELSTDGENWTTVAEKKNYTHKDGNEPVVHEFEPTEARYLKLNATKLTHDGNPSTYYLQIREIEAYNNDGVNVALRTNGTVAEGGNPLTSNETVTYEDYFNNVFNSGAKWVNIANTIFWDSDGPSDSQINNMKYLRENGVNITYRFTKGVPDVPKDKAEEFAKEFCEQVTPYVEKMKDYIDVWQIANEDNFPGNPYTKQKTDAYAIVVGKVADKIRELDPGCKIEIETALIDFNWTKDVMEAGLAGKIDVMGVHVYKEVNGVDNMIEENGTFIQGGVRHFPNEHPYKDYREEITEYKKLLQQYNPDCEVWCTETSINRGNNSYCVSELVQAKWLAREYIYHQMLGVGPTCWWTLDGIKTNDIEWGVLDLDGNRLDSWYALRNVANTMNNDYSATDSISAEFSNNTDMIYECFKNGDTYQIPYWVKAKMRTSNTGRSTDITVSGVEVKNAVAVDMITGVVQELKFEQDGDKVVFKNMIARDYPTVIRINSDAEYDVYNAEKVDAPVEKSMLEKIISSSTIIEAGNSKGIVRDNVKEIKTGDMTGTVRIIDDMTYVPLRFISEALNKKVYWLNGMVIVSDSDWDIDAETEKQLKEYFADKCKEGN